MNEDDKYPDTESDADKRAYHNLLERKRRDHIKDSFSSLRDVLPYFKGGKVRASRTQILDKAAEHIEHVKLRNTAHRIDIAELKKDIVLLEDEIDILRDAATTGNYDKVLKVITRPSKYKTKFLSPCSTSESDSVVDDDTTDSDDLPKKTRKRRRVSHLPKKAKQRNTKS